MIAMIGGLPAAASAEPASVESVVVTGSGAAFGTPDTLEASFAVETNAKTVGDALNRANTATTKMRDALVRGGVAKADLQTSNVTVSSTRKEDGPITGYVVNQGLTAKIRNLPKGGALMSAAIAAGGDASRLNGVSFAIEDDAALLVDARKKAFADARKKAELFAREAGRPLGRVIKVSEAAPGYSPQTAYKHDFAADAPVPMEPGVQRLTATVTVEWALDTPKP